MKTCDCFNLNTLHTKGAKGCFQETNRGDMKTIIRIKETSNGFAHWIRTMSGLVIIEFVGGK